LTATRFFPTSAALQDYLLEHAGPDTLVIVPHQRLAHQVWHRQRLAALAANRPAWEPVRLRTLTAWWSELFQGLWSEHTLAPPLVRLGLWGQALKGAPPPPGPTPKLSWAQTLDDAHTLLCRYGLPTLKPGPDDGPLVAWRRRVSRIYADLLRQGDWLSPGQLPPRLTAALRDGKISLPPQILVVGLETPAPMEENWLQELSRRTRVGHLQVRGDPQNIRQARVLPDSTQELHWVAAQLLELAHRDDMPLHRLAVTAMSIETLAPHLRRVLAELLGPPETQAGWAYNFSRGPTLGEIPLLAAAFLPLQFIAGGQRRQALVSLLLSPYYGAAADQAHRLARWDRIFREQGVDQGWDRLRQAVQNPPPEAPDFLTRLDRAWEALNLPAAPAAQWRRGLEAAWRELRFPRGLTDTEPEAWTRLTGLLREIETALGSEPLSPGEFMEWLKLGARRIDLPGPGIQTAGIQVLGLLEMRGLDFDHVFCLGMNSGTLPAPPRPLPLLAPGEKRLVLGGTYQSQHHFAAELFANLLGTAPRLTLTRPRLVDQEERVGTPLYLGAWEPADLAVLSVPHPAWLRAPAVQASFNAPAVPVLPAPPLPFPWPLPAKLSLSQVSAALGCPCRFLLDVLLKIRELPEIEGGLDPRDRGQLLHRVLADFTASYGEVLRREGAWDPHRAREMLREAGRRVLAPLSFDLHWHAEEERWLGEDGLLWEWLSREEERFAQGWRWLGAEAAFQDLQGRDWPFTLQGRIDRLDFHPETGELVVWDYKTGELPSAKQVLENQEEPQLSCYLLAVQEGRVPAVPAAAGLRAGFIGLKSLRTRHLKYEDFHATAQRWQEVLAAFAGKVAARGARLAAGDFRPDPAPAPEGNKRGACQYCPYTLICGGRPAPAPEEDEI
jgi:ATP-dependent helicase/nuclease subunit B